MRLWILPQDEAELRLVEEVLDVQDRAYVKRLMEYFGPNTRWVRLRLTPVPIPHLADVVIGQRPPVLTVSQDWVRWERPIRRKITVHEFVHMAGPYPHLPEVGFNGALPLDLLTPRVMADVARGTPRFDPLKFGIRRAPMPVPSAALRLDEDRRVPLRFRR